MTIGPALVYTLAGLLLAALITAAALAGRLKKGKGPGPASLEEIRGELKKLNAMFTVPHIRGGIGEVLLEELLRNWLSDSMFALQYSFQDGSRADAVIVLGDFLVAVDAKFPLESVREALESENGELVSGETKRALVRHMESIGAKYIRPEEGTLQFALMYIPSEKIYYHFFVDSKHKLYEEALRNGVVPVSPSSMFLYIQTVAYGLRGLSLPEREQELVRVICQVRKDLHDYGSAHNVLGTHIKNIVKSYEEGIRRLTKLEQTVEKLDRDA
jgi:DNA recombination protein RmuC